MIDDPTWGCKLRRATDDEGNTPLHIAAKYGNLEALRTLLEGNLQLYDSNKCGKTPIHMAAERGHIKWVTMLYSSK